MKRIKIIALFMGAMIFAGASFGQKGNVQMNLNYSVGVPLGNFKNLMTNNSSRGWQGNILYGINDKFAVGAGLGFQDFYVKKSRALYKGEDGSDISAVLSYSIQTIPLLAEGKYNFKPAAAVQPYVALGLGGNLILYRQFIGENAQTKSNFGFAARPEAGVFIPFKKAGETGITIGADYNFMPYNKYDIKNLNAVGIFAGIKFPIRK